MSSKSAEIHPLVWQGRISGQATKAALRRSSWSAAWWRSGRAGIPRCRRERSRARILIPVVEYDPAVLNVVDCCFPKLYISNLAVLALAYTHRPDAPVCLSRCAVPGEIARFGFHVALSGPARTKASGTPGET